MMKSRRAARSRLAGWLLIAMLVAPSLAQILSLTVSVSGSAITASGTVSSIDLSSGGDLTVSASASCGNLQWSTGNINLQPGCSLTITEAGQVYPSPSGQPVVLSGGSLACSNGAPLVVNSGANLVLQGSQLNNAQVQLAPEGTLQLLSCSVTAPLSILGSPSSQANIAQGPTTCYGPIYFSTPTIILPGGSLQSTNTGQIQVADNNELSVQGGSLCNSGQGASGPNINVVVGQNQGALLTFRGSAPCELQGGVISLQAPQSQLQVAPEATKTVTAPTVITGPGTSIHQGATNVQAPYTFEHSQSQISGPVACQSPGKLIISPGHTSTVQGGAQLSGSGNAASVESHSVGCDSCGQAAEVRIAPAPAYAAPAPVQLSSCSVGLKQSGTLRVLPQAHLVVSSPSELHGAGQVSVESNGVHEVQAINNNNHARTVVKDTGNLVISNQGQYICGPSHQLVVQGGRLSQNSAPNYDTIHLQSGGAVHFQPSPARLPAVCTGNAQIGIEQNSEVHIHPQAELQLRGPLLCWGAGPVNVEGHLNAQAPHTSFAPVNFIGGTHTLDTSVQHQYTSLNYDTRSTCNLQAGPQGFTPVQVFGPAHLGGTLSLRPGYYAPQGPVDLIRANNIAGSFANCVSNSPTLKGAVYCGPQAVTWYPDASIAPAGCIPVL